MKRKLLVLYSILLLAFGSTVILCARVNESWASSLFIAASVIVSLIILQGWMNLVRELVAKSNSALNKNNTTIKKWAFANIDLLEQNHDQIIKKFQVSADFISNLAHPDKLGSLNDLDSNDPIGKALRLIKSEMQKIKDEDEKRAWTSQGLAHFGEILRNKLDLKDYCQQIINNLARYVNANQGGLFIEYQDEDGERYLELTASYAYSNKKSLENRIFPGDGLLGQCMEDHDFITLADVPKTYVKIASGLGQATPKNITVAPLVFNNRFCGAVEFASFEAMKTYQMEFLKKVCENIASEIASIKSMEHTKVLLEESRTLTEELQMREEEMKQNMEELTATQEAMARKQIELSNTIKEAERRQTELNSYLAGINNTVASAEFDLDGKFKNANEIFLRVMGYSKEELCDRHFDYLMGEDQSVIMMWENLRLGKFFSGEFRMKNKIGKELWLTGTFNPIIIEGGLPEKIMMFAQFTTQEKEKLNDLTAMVHAMKSTLPVLEFNKDLVCKTANEKALKIFDVSRLLLRSKKMEDFIAPHYHSTWQKNVKEIMESDFSNFVIPFLVGSQVLNYEVSISVIRDLDGVIAKLIVILVKEVMGKVPVLATV